MLDVEDRIDAAIAIVADAIAGEIERNAGCRAEELYKIYIVAAVEYVIAGAARQRIVTTATVEYVIAGSARKRIVAEAAFQDIVEPVATQRVAVIGANDIFD